MDTPAPRHVLLAHHEPATRRLIRDGLTRESYRVTEASTATQVLHLLRRGAADAVILELRAGEDEGTEICTATKQAGSAALLCICEGGGEQLVIAALRAGADACIAAPFSVAELVARVAALLRRPAVAPVRTRRSRPARDVETIGDLRIDRAARTAFVGPAELHLGPREFDVLAALLDESGRVLSRRELIDAVWGEGHEGEPKTVDVHVHHLRAKLSRFEGVPLRIATVSRVGYRLDRLDRPGTGEDVRPAVPSH